MLGEVFINYGGEILYCSTTYEAFPDMVSDNGGKRVEVPLTPDCKYDLDGMLAAVGVPDLIDEDDEGLPGLECEPHCLLGRHHRPG